MDIIEELFTRLTVVQENENTYRGPRQSYRSGNVFGGQIIGQALSAAYQTIEQNRSVHSLHAYFIRGADPNYPIRYIVDRLRTGTSFDTRIVTAFQKENPVFSMQVSFQVDGRGPNHQDDMPAVPGPEACSSTMPDQEKMLENVPTEIKKRLTNETPIEFRYIHPKDITANNGNLQDRYIWIRAINPLPARAIAHRLMLAYVSDYSLVATLLYRHGYSFWDKDIQVASLDHAMWFHRDFCMDDWLLYAIHSPSANSARGLCLAHFYTRDGTMVATVAQEGLIRFAD